MIILALISIFLTQHLFAEVGYIGDYDLKDTGANKKFSVPFERVRGGKTFTTFSASSQSVLGVASSSESVRMTPFAVGAMVISTGTYDLWIATGLCDTCWRTVRSAQVPAP